MTIFNAVHLNELSEFSKSSDQLAIFERQAPQAAEGYMQKLMRISLDIAGKVRKENAKQDIQDILQEQMPAKLQDDPFYNEWLADMADVCKVYCDTLASDAICFWLGTERGCTRYHTDNVLMRLVVTYEGRGTEWLPNEAADRGAFANGAPNEQIIRDPSAIQFLKAWDIAIFRGGPQGLLHRTPDAALNRPSILMRLDPISFWENVLS